jgi:glycosyltransferase involved in cell wall biosynthesis
MPSTAEKLSDVTVQTWTEKLARKTARVKSVVVIGINWPVESFIERLVMGLVNSGLSVTIASSRKPDEKWLSNPRIEWLRLPSWNFPPLVKLFWVTFMLLRALLVAPRDLKLFWRSSQSSTTMARIQSLYRLMPFSGRRWDILYFPWNFSAVLHLPLFYLGCPVVISCRGSQIKVAPHNTRKKQLKDGLVKTFKLASAVHCVSEDLQREAIQYGLDPSKGKVIHPAVDPDVFAPSKVDRPADGKFHVLSVGSLNWRKGFDFALIGIRILLERKVPVFYEIIGAGEDHRRLLYAIADQGLTDHVKLHGKMVPDQLLSRLHSVDAFLLSSLTEGISNAALEAMSCGLPVVTTNCGGMQEAIVDQRHGFVVPTSDPVAIADSLERLWRNPELRKRFGTAARERIIREFSLQGQIEQFVNLFEGVAGEVGEGET